METNKIPQDDILLEIKNLSIIFQLRNGVAKAVDQLNLTIRKGSTMGLVGESGCGKSVTALSILQLLDEPGQITGGEILFKGQNLLELSKKEMLSIRGGAIAMVFQDATSALNPVLSIGSQMVDGIRLHQKISKKEATGKAEFYLHEVGIFNAKKQLSRFPHELSGGMKQRVMIAMALACEPDLLIADEPTTALDTTIQAQVLELMSRLKEKYNTSILMISHDLAVIAQMADDVTVMYAGMAIEQTNVFDLFADPVHPYTSGLLRAIPSASKAFSPSDELYTIPGNVPSLLELPEGCNFQKSMPLKDGNMSEYRPIDENTRRSPFGEMF